MSWKRKRLTYWPKTPTAFPAWLCCALWFVKSLDFCYDVQECVSAYWFVKGDPCLGVNTTIYSAQPVDVLPWFVWWAFTACRARSAPASPHQEGGCSELWAGPWFVFHTAVTPFTKSNESEGWLHPDWSPTHNPDSVFHLIFVSSLHPVDVQCSHCRPVVVL